MSFGDRTKEGLERWFTGGSDPAGPSWSDRIKGWLSSAYEGLLRNGLVGIFPPANVFVQFWAQKVAGDPNAPQGQRDFASAISAGGTNSRSISGWLLSILGALPGLLGIGRPQGLLYNYEQDRILRTARLDPDSIIRLWLRDKTAWASAIDDLRELGYSEERIAALQELGNFLPGPQDLVTWSAREVFEPDMISKYGLDSEFGNLDLSLFGKVGVTEEIARNYWRAHWQHASWNQILEMLHRQLITETDVREWFRLVEIPPYWRQLLIDSSYNVPTRVDVRRFWDMGTIDETRLRQIYASQGYHGQDLDDYVLWTKVYVALPDLLAQWKNGWKTVDDVRNTLVSLGMSEARAIELLQTKIPAEDAPKTTAERDVTRTDILNGVKKARITRAQAIEMLQDLGYSLDEAIFILDVNIPEDETEPAVKERELTKSDIAQAVKLQQISPSQAVDRLVNLRYSPTDAAFLATIYAAQIPAAAVEEARNLSKSDITRAYRLAVVSEAEATNLLSQLGYEAGDITILLESNVPPEDEAQVEELRQPTKADIKNAYFAGVLTESEFRDRMTLLDYSQEDITFLLQLYQRQAELAATVKPREASKADIVEAVKKGLITPETGYQMLRGLDFTDEASTFILQVRAEASPFSPVSYDEFKKLTREWRQQAGRPETWETERIREAAAVLVQSEKDVADLDEVVKGIEAQLIGGAEAANVPDNLKQARLARNRARAAARRARSEYDKEVALQKQLREKEELGR